MGLRNQRRTKWSAKSRPSQLNTTPLPQGWCVCCCRSASAVRFVVARLRDLFEFGMRPATVEMFAIVNVQKLDDGAVHVIGAPNQTAALSAAGAIVYLFVFGCHSSDGRAPPS